jgi:hypothetical protein
MGIPYTLCSRENRENLRPENSASSSPSGCGIPAMLNSQSATHWVGCVTIRCKEPPLRHNAQLAGSPGRMSSHQGQVEVDRETPERTHLYNLSKNQQLLTILQDGFMPLEHPSLGIRMHGGVEALPWKQSCLVMLHYGRPSSIFPPKSGTITRRILVSDALHLISPLDYTLLCASA